MLLFTFYISILVYRYCPIDPNPAISAPYLLIWPYQPGSFPYFSIYVQREPFRRYLPHIYISNISNGMLYYMQQTSFNHNEI